MANRRITREMAIQAAMDMRNAVYKEKLNNAQATLKKEADAFVKKYVPSPVLTCVEEYKDYFTTSCRVRIVVYDKESKEGEYSGSYRYILSEISMPLPLNYYENYRINTSVSKCKRVVAADDTYNELRREADKFQGQIENALLSLKTEKKITEQLPEALPYIKFPDNKSNLPAPIFSDIRAMLQSVTNNKQ